MPDRIVLEAERLLGLAEDAGLPLRVIGGVAVRLRTPSVPAGLERGYGDLDFATAAGTTTATTRLFESAGYVGERAFNTLNGKRRLIFHRAETADKADVFVGGFSMCHAIPIAERLALEPRTLPLAELLLTKLQIVELNEKDVRDVLTLLQGHGVGDGDGELVSAPRVAALCAADWGLWRTITANLEALRGHLVGYELDATARARIGAGIDALLEQIEAEPKSRGWRLRARVGERVRWYELPEEVG